MLATLLLTTLLTPLALCTSHRPQNENNDNQPTSTTNLPASLRALLSQADRVALHAALHESHSSFTDGTHENDIAAVEAIHRSSPTLATHIVELARRQNPVSNTTFTTSAAPVTTDAASLASSAAASLISSSGSQELLLTTYTDASGHPVTVSFLSLVAVAAPTSAGADGGSGSAGAKASATASGRLQNDGEREVSVGFGAVMMAAFVGLIGLA